MIWIHVYPSRHTFLSVSCSNVHFQFAVHTFSVSFTHVYFQFVVRPVSFSLSLIGQLYDFLMYSEETNGLHLRVIHGLFVWTLQQVSVVSGGSLRKLSAQVDDKCVRNGGRRQNIPRKPQVSLRLGKCVSGQVLFAHDTTMCFRELIWPTMQHSDERSWCVWRQATALRFTCVDHWRRRIDRHWAIVRRMRH